MLLGYADAKAQSNSSRAENYMGIRGRRRKTIWGFGGAPESEPGGKLYGDSGAPLIQNRSPAENYMGIWGRP